MILNNDISFLLYKHNCVIVPNFGAFIVNEKKVDFSPETNSISPKRSVVTFNSQIKNNDGLLANHISTNYNCTYEEGLKKIEDYITQLENVLKELRNVEIKSLGTFYRTKEEKLVFVPYHSVNFNTHSFGLPKLRLKKFEATELNTATASNEVAQTKPAASNQVVKAPAKPLVEKRRAEKRVEKQVAKVENSVESKRSGRQFLSNLNIINVLGSLFMIAMVFALLNFEFNTKKDSGYINNYAEFIESPIDNSNLEVYPEELAEQEIAVPNKKLLLYTIETEAIDKDLAQSLYNDLKAKYVNASIESVDDNLSQVSIIAFSKEKLANEYLELIQNNIDQKLVINLN